MRRALLVLSSLALVMSACGGGEVSTTLSSVADVVTTTQSPSTTSTTMQSTAIATSTTLSVDVNLATAEALVAALNTGDEQALDDLPWSNQIAKQDALDIARFNAALNADLNASSCEGETAQVIKCETQASDDLSDALGVPAFTIAREIRFGDSGQISALVSVTQDGGVGEVFTNWAWNIAYPDICDSPAQCAEALLGIVDEYETYAGSTVASYVAAYNAGDIDAVMALFTEESVITGHPAGPLSTGLTEIRELHIEDMDAASTVNPYTVSNVEVTDDTVSWDHIWVRADGNEFCKVGHEATIEDGKFVSWTWPGGGFDCP